MKYSSYPFKTRKNISSQEVSTSAILLQKAGFFEKDMAGVYSTLPFGLMVCKKIESIIRKHLTQCGAFELYLTSLQNPDVWNQSGRFDDSVIDVWFKTTLQNGSELGLANTHEEPITKLVSKFVNSYKDLPIALFQFQTKLRNELRAKNGILRTREFVMKDLYTFDLTEEDLDATYERYLNAYKEIFSELGVEKNTFLTFASGGSFCKYSHEFQLIAETGEDTIYVDYDKKIAINEEVYTDEIINELGLDKSNLKQCKSIEVGNIFKLKTKYSNPLNANYIDSNNEKHDIYMGCYGIGIGRTLASIVEVYNDENGIIWPKNLSPFQVHLIDINSTDIGQKYYEKLTELGFDVLWDDRKAKPGSKFADADLIGIPVRIVVSNRLEDNSHIELKFRTESEASNLSFDEAILQIKKFYE
jgi:prolyl-tRNA synthetase